MLKSLKKKLKGNKDGHGDFCHCNDCNRKLIKLHDKLGGPEATRYLVFDRPEPSTSGRNTATGSTTRQNCGWGSSDSSSQREEEAARSQRSWKDSSSGGWGQQDSSQKESSRSQFGGWGGNQGSSTWGGSDSSSGGSGSRSGWGRRPFMDDKPGWF